MGDETSSDEISSGESLEYENMVDESMVDFSRTDTAIFWSIKDCPIPRDVYVLAKDNIRIALTDLGYHGEDEEHKLLLDMLKFVLSRYPKPVNLMVLSKEISDPSEFLRVLQALKLRSCNILLVHPPDSAPESMLESPESVIRFTKLFGGGDPTINKSFTFVDNKIKTSGDSVSDFDK